MFFEGYFFSGVLSLEAPINLALVLGRGKKKKKVAYYFTTVANFFGKDM